MTHRIFGITGWKNSGKTTLTVKLVGELTSRGWKVSTVKHAHHHFDIDKEGTDSFRHRKAGAGEVAIVSDRRWALMHELADEAEPPLADIISRFAPCDLVLVEGYKREGHKKIETRRKEGRSTERLAAGDPLIVAVASDYPVQDETLPVYDLDDVAALADLIERETGLLARRGAK
ncbi:molybdopterin-guanine dinucleotide biosynthesis protein B [Phyllobacterium endophyticum]|uniref:Molybdopterin-guanine dinucleotide biosynthesis protein B n=1 Tax=Phyllobacterium endophyticum TaxID=1149773 RepID=A0A2P7AU15_9HYPH|nr:molybdopterin-guanine dinucleotide biosynthesis protein B [Phyllobacterium endophyticum]MBB3234146.1 molybdopterin-guanine dinucleotide biosynthesis protein B [Phyllobacterium endophyticum]PSH57712.1 molybdopterin-guanine dinucleotide biosynthesis protein B [Phyllobacterium endophyticum]TYR43906.1 molybdopterin-guanine dinucleotide biosynthesis protein B [Phyllobacterium endophyticum]